MRCGARPWIWSDYIWNHEEEFLRKMSRDILQSNWYYDRFADEDCVYTRGFEALERGGFEQIPAGSVWSAEDNLELMVDYVRPRVTEERLCGFMQTVWRPMMPNYAVRQQLGAETLGRAKTRYEDSAGK